MFFYPQQIAGDKFYLLPCRFFEFGFGGLCSFIGSKKNRVITLVSLIGIIAGLVISLIPFANVLLLLTVLFTSLFLLFCDTFQFSTAYAMPLRLLGKASYSLFIFHQIILAFYRYYFSQEITFGFFCVFVTLLGLISFLSYRYVEKKAYVTNTFLFVTIGAAIPICIISFLIYMNAGVVRDVPELCIKKGNVHRNMHAEYVDRIYSYDRDFEHNGKTKVLCIGNSFARDWANIMLESVYADSLDITYSFNCEERIKQRISEADIIFVYFYKTDLPEWFWNSVKNENCVYGIGVKSFGSSNGIVYSRRFTKNYFNTGIFIDNSFELDNNERKQQWQNNYIDMLSYVRKNDGSIRVFTDQQTFISQDCSHLTKEGAKYFASVIDFSKFFGD